MKRINCFQNFSGCNILQFDKYILKLVMPQGVIVCNKKEICISWPI